MFSRPRVPRVQRSTLVLIIAVAALAFPLGALAVHQFDDVPTGASFHDDVEALVAHGITSGCQADPPLYCPSNPVTRAQMAQFMNRLGSLDGVTPPSVDADMVDGIDSTGFLRTGAIVTSIDGSAWEPHAIAPSSSARFVTNVQFSGDGAAVLPIPGTSHVGTQTYGLASLQICIAAVSGGGFVDQIHVYRTASSSDVGAVFIDNTNRTAAGCFSVAPNVAVGEGLGLFAVLGGGGSAGISLGSVETTWSSVGTFTVSETAPADPAVVGPGKD